MSTAAVLFGTESGNCEMVAEDLVEVLAEMGIAGEVAAMDEVDVENLSDNDLIILVSSTYGEGDLPNTAVPFFESLQEKRPDLSHNRFAAFGLGDSTYDTYNQGIDILIKMIVDLGARQVGLTGRHDADSGLDAPTVAIEWARENLAGLTF
ncbi:flavodoxin domain-containing protein [Gordonia aquimaris]|uniref:Flavodoxin domain-containing protein n=1 Tax=Gordonia aquimaris TaxID=2984863 RepID=A0A9X3D1A1_9ACTN|nr:flavodoxin domain-containing protein [Gordonia aquimaris]MCX2963188.1 flavodoxin domain-containing protein [Gordonia aquimaris]